MSRFEYESFKDHSGKDLKIFSCSKPRVSAWLVRQNSFYSVSVFFGDYLVFSTKTVTRALDALTSKVKDLFPQAYRISLWGCDTREYFSSFNLLTYNRWHEQKMFKDIERSADHWSASKISLSEYFKSPPKTKY
jgi:hypothetical protein